MLSQQLDHGFGAVGEALHGVFRVERPDVVLDGGGADEALAVSGPRRFR